MRRELATCAFLSLLVATVFSPDMAMGLLLLAAATAIPVWETLFGVGQCSSCAKFSQRPLQEIISTTKATVGIAGDSTGLTLPAAGQTGRREC